MSTPDKIQRPSLARAFAPAATPDHTAGLSGLLPPVTDRPEPAQPDAAPRADKRPVTTEATSPQISEIKPLRTVRRASQDEGGVVNVGVYLEADVLDATRRAKRARTSDDQPDKTYDELLVDALAAVSEDDLRAYFRPAKAEDNDSLLQARRRRPRGSGGIQVQLRLEVGQRATLDQLADRVGAGSRSALVAAAYRLAYSPRAR